MLKRRQHEESVSAEVIALREQLRSEAARSAELENALQLQLERTRRMEAHIQVQNELLHVNAA